MISLEDKDQFVNAGVNYIYQLDGYNRSSVQYQIGKEFDEILELNEPDVMAERLSYFGIGKASDYLNRTIDTDEGKVLAGIRHLGGDKNKPFILVWPSFKITSIKKIVKAIIPHFEVFKPEMICYWSRPDCNDSNEQVVQRRFIAEIPKMEKGDLALAKPDSYYDWYESEYAQFHKENPEFLNRVQICSRRKMDACRKADLLFCYIQNEENVGLIAGKTDTFLEKPAIYLDEILIGHNYRGKGYANKLLASFVKTLTANYFICEIDSENTASTKTALNSGQVVFSQEIFVKI